MNERNEAAADSCQHSHVRVRLYTYLLVLLEPGEAIALISPFPASLWTEHALCLQWDSYMSSFDKYIPWSYVCIVLAFMLELYRRSVGRRCRMTPRVQHQRVLLRFRSHARVLLAFSILCILSIPVYHVYTSIFVIVLVKWGDSGVSSTEFVSFNFAIMIIVLFPCHTLGDCVLKGQPKTEPRHHGY